MATVVMERLGRLFINLQGVRRVPQMLREAMPSLPGTLRASEVPPLFRDPYIHSGYRPLGQPWRYYFLSLFQRHNETVNVWTHLLGGLLVLTRALQLGQTVDFAGDAHSWPLLILLSTAFLFMAFSATAHLLSARSALLRHALYFLDYVGVALFQFGSAGAHLHYAAGRGWRGGGGFLALAALLAWLSCLGGCCGRLWGCREQRWGPKAWQLLPCSLAYGWDVAPLVQRISACLPACEADPPARLHAAHMLLFLLSVACYSSSLPERCFPGRCDFLPQGHQLFHLLLVLSVFSQLEASHLDYLQRRALYTQPSSAHAPLLILALFSLVILTSALTAILSTCRVQHLIGQKHKAS